MGQEYRNLEVYQLGYGFAVRAHKLIEHFPEIESKSIGLQIRRAAVSIPLNIAEGSSRRSYREFLTFLTYAHGSGKELEVLLNMSRDLGYISAEQFSESYEALQKFMAKMILFLRYTESLVPRKKTVFTGHLIRGEEQEENR